MLLRPFDAPFHEGANGGGRSIKNRDAVLRDDAPETVRFGPVRRAFIHQARSAVREWAVNDIAVAGDPTDVGGAPIDVSVFQIEDVTGRELCAEQVARCRVKDALRL